MNATQQTESKSKFKYFTTVNRCKACGHIITVEQDTKDHIDIVCPCGGTKFIQEK